VIKAAQKGTIEWAELFEFDTATDEAIFLFGADVEAFLDQLRQRCIMLHTTHVHLNSAV
jgi:hypothetical protein